MDFEDLVQQKLMKRRTKGGGGSGNFGHAGRPGQVGGSGGGGSATADVSHAITGMEQGHNVTLSSEKEVGTLLNRLADVTRAMADKGKGKFNLCRVSVPGTNLFCGETTGRSRAEMPQLSGTPKPGTPADKMPKDSKGEVDLIPGFRDHLIAMGAKIRPGAEWADTLKASQTELDGSKVSGMMKAMEGGLKIPGTILISSDNYVVDGHHRWAAQVGLDEVNSKLAQKIPIERIDMPIKQLLKIANKYTEEVGMPHRDMAGQVVDYHEPKWFLHHDTKAFEDLVQQKLTKLARRRI